MTCQEFGQQACTENDRTADKIGLMLDQDDPRKAADTIRNELYDRPPSLALDLIDRIQHYDEQGVGADLRVEPVVRQVPNGYGGYQYVDTGDREVYVDSQLGRDQVAILKGAPQQQYDDYPYPDQYRQRQLDPLSMITSLFIGGLFGNDFCRWQHQPRRPYWQDGRGGMWYPQPGGMWGNQQYRGNWPSQYSQDPSRFYGGGNGLYPDQFSIRPWRDQQEWYRRQQMRQQNGSGINPDWQRRQQQQGVNPADWYRRQQQQGTTPDWIRRQQQQQGTPGSPEWWQHRRQQQQDDGRPPDWQQRWRQQQDWQQRRRDQTAPGQDQTRPWRGLPPAGQDQHQWRGGQPPQDQPRRGGLPDQQFQRGPIPDQRQQHFRIPEQPPAWRNGNPNRQQGIDMRQAPAQQRIVPRETPHVVPQNVQPGQDRRRQR